MSDPQDNYRIVELARKWQDGTITAAEKLEFDEWYGAFNDAQLPELSSETPLELKERLYASIIAAKDGQRKTGGRVLLTRFKWAMAAAVLLLLGSVSWWYMARPHKAGSIEAGGSVAVVGLSVGDSSIQPGGNKAILTLGNGRQVVLNTAKNGLLARQGATGIVKENDSALVYKPGEGGSDMLFNTVATPRGGQYSITLSDGTRVWLNAASSIRFPTAFAGKERVVQITGEAYFEIAANKSMPFKVEVDKMKVEVLGTEFNIMAYADEGAIKTTLVNGAVKVSKENDARVLRPGQQAQLKEGVLRTVDNADVDAAVAWKNGQTLFANEDISAILRKVSRWYDVDIEYRGEIPKRRFTGGISRRSDISAFLKILELSRIHFSVEGKKLVLMP